MLILWRHGEVIIKTQRTQSKKLRVLRVSVRSPPLLLHSLHHLFQQRAERKQHYRRNARHHCKQREKFSQVGDFKTEERLRLTVGAGQKRRKVASQNVGGGVAHKPNTHQQRRQTRRRQFVDHRKSNRRKRKFANRMDEIQRKQPPHRDLGIIVNAVGSKSNYHIANRQEHKADSLFCGRERFEFLLCQKLPEHSHSHSHTDLPDRHWPFHP